MNEFLPHICLFIFACLMSGMALDVLLTKAGDFLENRRRKKHEEKREKDRQKRVYQKNSFIGYEQRV